MDRLRFFAEVVASGPILYAGTAHADAKAGMVKHWPVTSLAELEDIIVTRGTARSCYFCPASFERGRFTDPDGKGRVGRRKDEVVRQKSFYADIDLKNTYTGIHQALAALQETSLRLRLDPTIVVETGGGLHVYWVIDEEIDRHAWQPLAEGLKAALITGGLKIDPVATADGARFLRVPGTVNIKPGRNGFVTVAHEVGSPLRLSDVRSALNEFTALHPPSSRSYSSPMKPSGSAAATEAWLKEMGVGVSTPISVEDRDLAEQLAGDLSGGVQTGKGPADFNLIIGRCASLRHLHETGGADASEPVFKDALAVVAHCNEPSKWAHSLAHKSAHYTPGSAYVDDKLAERHGRAPALCTTFETHSETAELCKGCVYRSLIKTPKQLGYDSFRALDNFDVQPDGSVMKRVNDGTKADPVWVWEPAFPEYKFRDFTLQDTLDDQILHFNVEHRGRVRPYEVPVRSVVDLRSFRPVVARMMTGRDAIMNTLLDYNLSWISKLRNTTRHSTGSAQLGWTSRNGMDGIALGDRTVWANGTVEMTQNLGMLSHYGSRGDINKWLDAAKVILSGPVELHAPLAAAVGSLLLKLVGGTGAVVALYAGTGYGKSTATRVAAAMFGDPKSITVTATDTHNSVVERAALSGNLFVPADEIAVGRDPRPLADMVFQLLMGRSKARLTSTGQQLPTRAFSLITMIGTNSRLREIMAQQSAIAEAGEARVFEIIVPRVSRVKDPDIDWVIAQLDANYGVAGVKVAEHLLAHKGAITQQLKEVGKELAVLFPDQAELRYVLQSVQVLAVGYILLGTIFGLPIRASEFVNMLIHTAKAHGSAGSAANSMAIGRAAADTPEGALELLHRFFEDRRENILRSMDENYTVPPTGMPKAAISGDRMRGPIAAHWVDGAQRAYVSEEALRKWADLNHVQKTTWIDQLWRIPACLGRQRVPLGRGVAGVAPIPTRVTVFDLEKI